MKNIKTKLAIFLSSLFLVSCAGKNEIIPLDEAFEDDIVYKDNTVADLKNPHFIKRADGADDDDDEEEEIGEVNVINIHYVNDDKDCKARAFYIWVNGVDGHEYSDANEDGAFKDIVTYKSDGTQMTISINLKEDARFEKIAAAKANHIMYIIKYKMRSTSDLNWGKQSEDVELKFKDFPPVDGVVDVWCTPAAGGGIAQFDTEAKTQVDGVKLAQFIDWKTIKCSLTKKAVQVSWRLYAFDETYFKATSKQRQAIKENYLIKSGINDSAFNIELQYNAHINVVYSIVSKDLVHDIGLEKTIFVSEEKLYETSRFNTLYNYNGNDLGFTYSKQETTFKVWAPVAANMSLYLYTQDTDVVYGGEAEDAKGWHMNYTPNGVWTLTVRGDLDGYYYNYGVDTWNGSTTTMDPYATSCGACGVRALVYDKAKTDPVNWSTLPTCWDKVDGFDIKTPQELTIYEVQVQDFTGDSSWVSSNTTNPTKRGTFNAFVESGTTYTDKGVTVSTGYDHLKELGIGAVQLVPVFDSDNNEVDNYTSEENKLHPELHKEFNNAKYNWGYNPLNYNCVEGAYSSNPHDGYARVKEFKNMVYELAKINCRVIMDVVYNHVSSPSGSCFNKLMPRYFFRYDAAGELYDGSGCHNEFKSEATMARKYIVDSVTMWAREYKIKGFRFDLMALIDTGTMDAVQKALYKVDPDIYIYGEGWTSGGFHGGKDFETGIQTEGTFCCNTLGDQVYTKLYTNSNDEECYLGGFNDLGRNKIKGNNDPGYGFINQVAEYSSNENRYALQNMIYGAHQNTTYDDTELGYKVCIGANPKQTVNYASCHDNFTLADQLYLTMPDCNIYNIKDATLATHALVFASNAAAFMYGGEELLRTKDASLVTDPEEVKALLPNTYVERNGHKISHNSYNSPFIVNTFKWGNKISVTLDDVTISTNDCKLTESFASLIALHKAMPKYDYHTLYAGENGSLIHHFDDTSTDIVNFSWAGTSECAIGIQYNNYFIFVSGKSYGEVNVNTTGMTRLFKSGTLSDGDKVCLGDSAYGKGFACAIYRQGGSI